LYWHHWDVDPIPLESRRRRRRHRGLFPNLELKWGECRGHHMLLPDDSKGKDRDSISEEFHIEADVVS